MNEESYLNAGYTLRSWFLTTDHKRIAWLYLVSLTAFFFIGGAAATLIRIELVTPAGDLVSDDSYNKLFTIHGIIIVTIMIISHCICRCLACSMASLLPRFRRFQTNFMLLDQRLIHRIESISKI